MLAEQPKHMVDYDQHGNGINKKGRTQKPKKSGDSSKKRGTCFIEVGGDRVVESRKNIRER